MPEPGEGKDWVGGSMDAAIFSAMMFVAAFLGRGNPYFIYPHILWSFLAALVFNLAQFSMPAERLSRDKRMALSVCANVIFVTLIIHYSGAGKSYFWVMYLLPIFTGCLSFGTRGILATVACVTLALVLFHVRSLRADAGGAALELAVKAATLLASAGVTMRAAVRERGARIRLEKEQERARRERLETQENVQHMDRLATLGTLSAGVAHELNTPLTNILGFTEHVLSREMPAQETKRLIRRVEASARRCKDIIENLTSFARKQIGRRRPCSVNSLVRQCVELKRHDCMIERIAMEEDYGADLPELLLSGPEFQQVIFNLLTNAQQAIRSFRKSGGRIRTATLRSGDHIQVEVEDNGPGIRPEHLEKIWEPFFTTKGEGEGTGLGLAISRKIVHDQGGAIHVTSTPGQGTSFLIQFPAGLGAR